MTHLLPVHWLQLALFFVVLFACVKPVGLYIAKVYEGERTFLTPAVGWIESGFYKLIGLNAQSKQDTDWKTYAVHLLVFSGVSFLFLYVLLRVQSLLPFSPQALPAISPHLAFNIAASFITNTNWQSYSGEAALKPFTQMAGLTVQNFLSAAVGMAVAAAVIRGFVRKNNATVGNFWVDVTRGILYILLPFSLVFAVILGSQGVVQTFQSHIPIEVLEPYLNEKGDALNQRTIAAGPVASQVAIKQLGTNGGGFFNVNAAHPFENPTALSSFLETLAILLIPASFCITFGRMVRDMRQGWALLIAMTIVFVPLFLFCLSQEQAGNAGLAPLAFVDQATAQNQPGGNMEGKEARFGIVGSVLWSSATTAAAHGSVNSMHDSYTPLGGLVPLVFMQLGEVIFGGAGSGIYGILVFVLIAVFIAGLMVGRTPEYLGKKIQIFEMKMVSLVLIVPPLLALGGTALAVSIPAGQAGVFNPGPHGFTEVLYAFTSASHNNGSAFAGLSASSAFYDVALGFAMLAGRFWVMIFLLAMAGSLAAKNIVPSSPGTFLTHGVLFIGLLAGVIILIGFLTYLPALALGPLAEYIMTQTFN